MQLFLQEESYVLADLGGSSIYRRESRDLIRSVRFYHCRYFGGIYFDMIRAAAVGGFVDRYLFAVRRIKRLVEIVHSAHGGREHFVQLDDNLVRHAADSRHNTYSGSRHDRSVLAYIRSLDNSELRFRQETVTQVLRHVAQVSVEIMCSFGVDLFAHGFVRLIRCTELDSVRTCQSTVTTVTHRSTGLQTYAERLAFGMQTLCALRQSKRNRLRHSGGGKATHAQDVTMLYQFGSFFCRHERKHIQ